MTCCLAASNLTLALENVSLCLAVFPKNSLSRLRIYTNISGM